MASDWVKRLYMVMWIPVSYNPFHLYDLVVCDSRKCFAKEASRVISFFIKGVLGRYMNCAPLPTLLTPNSSLKKFPLAMYRKI